MQRINTLKKHLSVNGDKAEAFMCAEGSTMNGVADDYLFDHKILSNLPWNECKSKYRGDVTILHPGPNLLLRPLSVHDYDRGFLTVLQQLTKVGEVTRQQFEKRFEEMKTCSNTYYVLVIEDERKNHVIGCATLVLEQKFIHSAAMRGRIEDVVVSEDYRGLQLGKLLVDVLILLARNRECYKLTLECKEENIKFYENLGFTVDSQRFLIQRFKD